ncbi:putative Xaa-Pro aminopeptidase P [Leucoagaricus sp. SymC.cos]|nr:putative Xaa-Pro aminopeptidase P [Leucoagaricus sp. SymC.cos]
MGAKGTHTIDTTTRLQNIRALMRQGDVQVDAYVVPSEDQHSSEYLAEPDKRRAYISGFNGSAGCAIVTLTEAFLFTDGRYFLQAEKQLDSNWNLMRQGLPDVPTWQEFLYKKLPEGSKIGIDPHLITAQDAETLNKELEPRGSKLVLLSKNLVDEIWTDRPGRRLNPVFHLDEKYSGQSPAGKVAKVREEMKKKNAKAVVVTLLDEVAWLFNLRGSDIDYNPVFFSYAIVTEDKVCLFISPNQINEAAHKYLDGVIDIHPYKAFLPYLKDHANQLQLDKDNKVWIGNRASLAVAEAIGKDRYFITRTPLCDLKAIKNATELEGFRQSHIRDGVALARYFAWLEEQLNNGVVLNECQGADQLEKYRSELDLFMGLSFDTISSSGPNGAIIHYSPDPNDCAIINKDEIYLCDSGAQFMDGTTDVTRTWHFGTPTAEEKIAFTRVLQGHIAIDSAVFPNGTTGFVIDSWARRYLWKDGLDYRHGTGHGVGHFLNVHEGPHGIGVRIAYNSAPMKPGMTLSNEPGYYEDGKYGVRLENVVLVQEVKTPNNFGDKGFLGFERVTMSPIHKKLIDLSLLNNEEKKWVDDYHVEVWEKVSPLLRHDKRALNWLKRETTPL